MVDFVNSIFQNGITLENNLNGQIIENIALPASGEEIKIPHRLKAVPKYRIILRQDGVGVVVDGGDWNENYITLKGVGLPTASSGAVIPSATYTVDGTVSGDPAAIFNSVSDQPLLATVTLPDLSLGVETSTEDFIVTILLLRG